MTDKEHAALSNEVAAKVLGYRLESGVMHYDGAELPWTVWRDTGGRQLNPRPLSTDIAAAWEVVERLREGRWEFELHSTKRGQWEARFIRGNALSSNFRYLTAVAATMPLAICEAALKTKEKSTR